MAHPATSQFNPDFSRPPGDYLRITLESRGMRVVDFATRCGRPSKTISEILSGATAIMPETALQFERVLGDMPASLWLNWEAQYQLCGARVEGRRKLETEVSWMKKFPVNEMQKCNYLPHHTDPIERVESLFVFFGVSSSDAWSEYWESKVSSARFKQSANHSIDQYAVSAWLRRGDADANDVQCELYSEATFRAALLKARELTNERWPAFRSKLVELFRAAGVALVFVPNLSRTGLRGAAYWAAKDKAVIIVSDRLKSEAAFWFALFHEAMHILHHSKKALFLDYPDDRKEPTIGEEKEADEGAANTLISQTQFREMMAAFGAEPRNYTESVIRAAAKRVGVSPALVLRRLQHEGVLPWRTALTTTFNRPIEF